MLNYMIYILGKTTLMFVGRDSPIMGHIMT